MDATSDAKGVTAAAAGVPVWWCKAPTASRVSIFLDRQGKAEGCDVRQGPRSARWGSTLVFKICQFAGGAGRASFLWLLIRVGLEQLRARIARHPANEIALIFISPLKITRALCRAEPLPEVGHLPGAVVGFELNVNTRCGLSARLPPAKNVVATSSRMEQAPNGPPRRGEGVLQGRAATLQHASNYAHGRAPA